MGVDWQMEHLNVYAKHFSIGILMLLVTSKILSMLSLTSLNFDDTLDSLTNSAVRLFLTKGAINSSSEFEEVMLIKFDICFFPFKSESFTA